jgi:ribose 5-phosphate isomerase B
MKLRVAIAADHGGFALKEELIRRLADSLDIVDKGAKECDTTDDYPDFVELVGHAVGEGEVDRGIVICGSGVGACIAANKMQGVRACVCHDTYSAHQGVEHDDMNVLCLGARVVGVEVATELAVAFLMARFSGEERHIRRLEKVAALERERLSRRENVLNALKDIQEETLDEQGEEAEDVDEAEDLDEADEAEDEVEDELEDEAEDQVEDEAEDEVEDELEDEVEDEAEDGIEDGEEEDDHK